MMSDNAPDGTPARHVWRRTLMSAWFAQTCAMMGFSFVMPFLRFYLRDDLGVIDTSSRAYWSAFIMSAPAFLLGLAAPFWGILADRVGRKLMVMRAMFAGAVIIWLMSYATSPTQLLMLRFAQGAFTGTMTASAALVASVSPSDRAGFSLGLMQAGIFAGNAAGTLGGGMVSDAFGGRTAFMVAGCFLLAGGVVVTLFAKEGNTHPREARRVGAEGSTHGLRDVLRNPVFITIIGLMLVMSFSRGFPNAIFQEYVELFVDGKEKLNTTVGLLHSVTFIVAGITSVVVGWLSDRIGHGPLVVAGTILSGALCIPQAWVTTLPGLLALRALLGVAAGTVGPAMGRFIHNTIPRASHGKAFGLVQSASACGWAFGPLSGGLMNAWLIPVVGAAMALRLPFAVAGVFQILVGLGAWYFVARAGRVATRGARQSVPVKVEPMEEA
jgi:DHA1 family multidrug resistance protein-like MFS transporter